MGIEDDAEREMSALRKEIDELTTENKELKDRLDRLESMMGVGDFGKIFPEVDMSRQLKKYIPASRLNQNISGNAPQMFDADTRETWYFTSDSNVNSTPSWQQDIMADRVPLGEVKIVTVLRDIFWSPIGSDHVPQQFQIPGVIIGEYYNFYVRDGHWLAKIGSYWDIILEAAKCVAGGVDAGSSGGDNGGTTT